ncbi:MAG: hypothetical protein U9Q94_04990, partial [Candidatus Bipolaricaulota bacterium]|nr:hypothetical protein [Candidatus Bipolaricaulota bacterium]
MHNEKQEFVTFSEFKKWAENDEDRRGLLLRASCLHPKVCEAKVIRLSIQHGNPILTVRTRRSETFLLTLNTGLRALVFSRSDLIPVVRQAGYAMHGRKADIDVSKGRRSMNPLPRDWLGQKLSEHGIKHLCHFTPLQNVPMILEHGLLPRGAVDRINSKPLLCDEERWDRQYDASCLSVSFPNYKMLYSCHEQ